MEDWRKNRIESAKNGTNPMLMIETNGGYAVFGDTQFLHGHVFPRYEWESEERKKKPVWLYDESNWFDCEKLYDENKHKEIRENITQYLKDYYSKV